MEGEITTFCEEVKCAFNPASEQRAPTSGQPCPTRTEVHHLHRAMSQVKSFRMKRIFGLRICRGETQHSHQRHVVLHDCATWDALWDSKNLQRSVSSKPEEITLFSQGQSQVSAQYLTSRLLDACCGQLSCAMRHAFASGKPSQGAYLSGVRFR